VTARNKQKNINNMNRIIALRGRGNSGKSTTIRLLYDLLLQNRYQLISSNFNVDGGDFISIFAKNGKLIGVTSSGDTYDLVHHRLQELINANCNLCVCACRTFDRVPPGTNAAIIEFTDYENQFIEKTVEDNEATQRTSNESDAQILFSAIENLI
jgi:hypothetical protein